MDAQPEILNHNVETVPRLFRKVQPQDHYEWAMATLTNAKQHGPAGADQERHHGRPGRNDGRSAGGHAAIWSHCGVDILTVGQYLQPSKQHLPVERFYLPEEFDLIDDEGLKMGFKWVESGPLVRSSYRAEQQVRELSKLNHFRLHEDRAAGD